MPHLEHRQTVELSLPVLRLQPIGGKSPEVTFRVPKRRSVRKLHRRRRPCLGFGGCDLFALGRQPCGGTLRPAGADPWGGVLLADFLPADHARTLYDLSRDRIGHLIYDAPGPPNVLLHNLGDGRFAATAAVWRNTLQATWADYDRDGDPDLYLANDFAANNLLRNDGGTLVDVTAESGAADPGFGMGASWADYDGDGRQDLYVTNMHSSAGRRITEAAGLAGAAFAPLARGNSLLRNGREGFTLVADSPVEDGGWGWGGSFWTLITTEISTSTLLVATTLRREKSLSPRIPEVCFGARSCVMAGPMGRTMWVRGSTLGPRSAGTSATASFSM